MKGLKEFDTDERPAGATGIWRIYPEQRAAFHCGISCDVHAETQRQNESNITWKQPRKKVQDSLMRLTPGWMPNHMAYGLKDEIEFYWAKQKTAATVQKP